MTMAYKQPPTQSTTTHVIQEVFKSVDVYNNTIAPLVFPGLITLIHQRLFRVTSDYSDLAHTSCFNLFLMKRTKSVIIHQILRKY